MKNRISVYFDNASMAIIEPSGNRTARINACLQRYNAMIIRLVPELTLDEWRKLLDALERTQAFGFYGHTDYDMDPLKDITMPSTHLRLLLGHDDALVDRILVAEIASRFFNHPDCKRKPLHIVLRALGLELADPDVPLTEFVTPLTAQPRRPLSPG